MCINYRAELYTGDRKGVRPLDKVPFRLSGPAPHGEALLHAARLGLELENDVRVASDRLKLMQVARVPQYVPLVSIRDPIEVLLNSSHDMEEGTEVVDEMPLL